MWYFVLPGGYNSSPGYGAPTPAAFVLMMACLAAVAPVTVSWESAGF
jgi:hypothetical protein